MMEGYFVRTLGMHRVYNSAFMNMLKNEENDKYRATIKNTMEFDPEILKRFVNFMNNPDEETAVAQFGKGDKYFGICTLLVTMPGLPMFGHGQIEGFEEKYGMEYRRSYRDEQPDGYLVDRHEREIFPLMKRRYLFSGSAMFRIYDLYCEGGSVNENVFAYSNRVWAGGKEEKALIFYNNSYYETSGWIKASDPAIPFEDGTRRDSLSEALAIHGENQYFTLLREQKSNLWFIRSSKAISENGFFVGLKGYETQVYLDIYEAEDDVNGRWARLNNDLNGGGTPDPLAAIKDIFLGELYYRFTEFFKPEIIENLCDLSEKQATALKKLAGEYIKTAAHFIKGADGAYDAWAAPNVTSEKSVSRKFTAVGKDTILAEFETFIDRLAKIKPALKKAETPLFIDVSNRIKNGNLLNAIILGYGLLSLLSSIIGKEATGSHAANLAFTHWDLGRKLREIFRRLGAMDNEAWKIIDIARVVLSKTKAAPFWKKGTKFDAAQFASLIIEENYLDDDFKRILGINHFDDVTWFNKEGFEDALFYSSLFFLVENSVEIPIEERIDRVFKIYDVLSKAEKKSGYRLDYLLDSLISKPKAKTPEKVDKMPAAMSKEKATEKINVKEAPKPAAKPASKKNETRAKPDDKIELTEKKEPEVKSKVKPAVKSKEKLTMKTKSKPAAKSKAKATAKKIKKSKAVMKSKTISKKATTKPKTKTAAKPKTSAKAKPAIKSKKPAVKSTPVAKAKAAKLKPVAKKKATSKARLYNKPAAKPKGKK
jgi:hypothetical protein